MAKLEFLITGTGRCGTVFVTRLLSSLGVPCGHESVFDCGGIDRAIERLMGDKPIMTSNCSRDNTSDKDEWFNPEIVADSSYMAAPFLGHRILNGTRIVHLVRNPVQVVNSFCNYLIVGGDQDRHYFAKPQPGDHFESFIYEHVPELRRDDLSQFDRGCLYWVRWNELIEKHGSFFFHRIEDDVSKLLAFFNLKASPVMFSNPKINSYERPCEPFTPDAIIDKSVKAEFLATAHRYGYQIS